MAWTQDLPKNPPEDEDDDHPARDGPLACVRVEVLERSGAGGGFAEGAVAGQPGCRARIWLNRDQYEESVRTLAVGPLEIPFQSAAWMRREPPAEVPADPEAP